MYFIASLILLHFIVLVKIAGIAAVVGGFLGPGGAVAVVVAAAVTVAGRVVIEILFVSGIETAIVVPAAVLLGVVVSVVVFVVLYHDDERDTGMKSSE